MMVGCFNFVFSLVVTYVIDLFFVIKFYFIVFFGKVFNKRVVEAPHFFLGFGLPHKTLFVFIYYIYR
jgi:hypothetical protein